MTAKRTAAGMTTWGILFVGLAQAAISTGTMTLEEVLAEVRRRNPEIRSAEAAYGAARAEVWPARMLPDPMFGINYWRIPWGYSIGRSRMKMWEVSQDIPFPLKLFLRGSLASHTARGMGFEAAAARRRVEAETTSLYYRIWSLEEEARLQRIFADYLRRAEPAARRRYEAGHVSQIDLLRLQNEADKALNEARSMAEELRAARRALNTILDRPPDAGLGRPERPRLERTPKNPSEADRPEKAAELPEEELDHSPMVLAEKHHAIHAGYGKALAWLDFVPDFTLGLARMSEPEGLSYNFLLMGRVPLYFWKQSSEVAAASRRQRQMRQKYQAMRNEVRRAWAEAWAEAENRRRTALLYEEAILPRAKAAWSVAEASYRAGRLGFLDFLETGRAWLEEEIQYVRVLRDYAAAKARLAELAAAEGHR